MLVKLFLLFVLINADPPLSFKEKLYLSYDPFVAERESKIRSGVKDTPPPPPCEIVIDMKRYDLFFQLDFNRESINGYNTITCAALEEGQNTIYLDCIDIEADSVKTNNRRMDFMQVTDTLKIFWESELPLNETVTFTVYFHGQPKDGLFFGITSTDKPICETTSEPIGVRHWFPCQDRPDDKVLVSMKIAVPNGFMAVSNGLYKGMAVNENETVYSWESQYQTASYLIFFAASYYDIFKQEYKDMGIKHYTYPEHKDAAQEAFKNMPEIMSLFADKYGEYPFIKEKYGMIEVTRSGAMENQTITAMSQKYYAGSGAAERVAAHELAHHWWGDEVTCATWYDLWLNESMATYSEIEYFKHFLGEESMPEIRKQYYDWIFHYLDEIARWKESVYGYHRETFSYLVYGKGAFVLEMLRLIIGDNAFYASLMDYKNEYSYNHAYTEDFIEAFERNSKQNLNWFFKQWIYSPGWPIIVWDYETNGNNVRIYLEQVQSRQHQGVPLFKAPIEILFKNNDSQVKKTVWMDGINGREQFDFNLDFSPTEIIFNPEVKLLCEVFYKTDFNEYKTAHFSKLPEKILIAPQPCKDKLRISLILNEARYVEILIYDNLGRRVKTLIRKTKLEKGTHTFKYDINLSSGHYYLVEKERGLSQSLIILK
ncbi:MAG: M1 family metallopeptidase [Candidatus Coatesbacteria bacterium]|nr:M1 family metallopeptidase [Candidatus Coatesbacteria bacterium]